MPEYSAEVMAGDGGEGTVDGTGLAARFNRPYGLEFIDPYFYITEATPTGAFRRVHIETLQVETLSSLGNYTWHLKKHPVSGVTTSIGGNVEFNGYSRNTYRISTVDGSILETGPSGGRANSGAIVYSGDWYHVGTNRSTVASFADGMKNGGLLFSQGHFHKLRDLVYSPTDNMLYYVGNQFGGAGLHRRNLSGGAYTWLFDGGGFSGRFHGICEDNGVIYYTAESGIRTYNIATGQQTQLSLHIPGTVSSFYPAGITVARGHIWVVNPNVRVNTSSADDIQTFPTPASNTLIRLVPTSWVVGAVAFG